MDPGETASRSSYRPAMRGFMWGSIAVGIRCFTMVLVALAMTAEVEGRGGSIGLVLLPVLNLLATVVALVGVGYSAIATHRGDRGALLALAWIFSVVAAISDIEPFIFVL